MLQFVALVQHTVRCHTDPALTQFIQRFAFLYISKEEINVFLHIRFFRFYYFCQRARLYLMLVLRKLLRIQDCCPEETFRIHLLVNVHRSPGILWFHNQLQFIISKITLHCIVPSLVLHIQKIRKNMHIHELAAALVQAVTQFESRLFQLSRISLLSLLQFF